VLTPTQSKVVFFQKTSIKRFSVWPNFRETRIDDSGILTLNPSDSFFTLQIMWKSNLTTSQTPHTINHLIKTGAVYLFRFAAEIQER
jgi:hypothetical protein